MRMRLEQNREYTASVILQTVTDYYGYIEGDYHTVEYECPICDGDNEVMITEVDGDRERYVTCPHCHGTGTSEVEIYIEDYEIEDTWEDEKIIQPYGDNSMNFDYRSASYQLGDTEKKKFLELFNRATNNQLKNFGELKEKLNNIDSKILDIKQKSLGIIDCLLNGVKNSDSVAMTVERTKELEELQRELKELEEEKNTIVLGMRIK